MDTFDSVDSLLSILVLWGGLLLMLWGLNKGLAQVEASLDSEPRESSRVRGGVFAHNFHEPKAVTEIIGEYMGAPIYKKITVDGVDYSFDRVQPPGASSVLQPDEVCVSPGLVYRLQREIRKGASG